MMSKILLVIAFSALVLCAKAEESSGAIAGSNAGASPSPSPKDTIPSETPAAPDTSAGTTAPPELAGSTKSDNPEPSPNGDNVVAESQSSSMTMVDGKVVDQHSQGERVVNNGGNLTKSSWEHK